MKKIIIIIVLLIAGIIQMFSQKKTFIFNYVSRSDLHLTASQSEKADRMIANPIYSEHYFVEVNEIKEVQLGGKLPVNMPDMMDTIIYAPKTVEYDTSTEYKYIGELDTCIDKRTGYFTLIAHDSDIFGQFSVDGQYYELFDFGGRKNIIFKVDTSYMNQRICKQDSSSNPPQQIIEKFRNGEKISSSIQYRNSPTCDVRVLVLYTDKADQVGNPVDAAYLGITQSNEIFKNSDVNMTFKLAGVRKLEGYQERQGYNGCYKTVHNIYKNEKAKNLRNEYQADMVVLYADCNDPHDLGYSLLEHWGDPEYAYVVVDIDANSKRYTFTHELTHDMGCKHLGDNRGAPDYVEWAQGWSWKKSFHIPKWHGTIHDTYDKSRRHMNVSNPMIFDGKYSTGTYHNNNALQLNNMACIVSDYRDFVAPMTIYISGPHKGDNSGIYTWCVDITGCDNVVDIQWEYSYDGFNFYHLQSGGNCFTGQLPYGEDLILRVKVLCSDGQTAEDWHTTLNLDKDRCFKVLEHVTKTKNIQVSNNSMEISPNPVSNIINLEYFVNESGEIRIEIIDVLGKKVVNLRKNYNFSGNYFERIDINQLEQGFYTVRVIFTDGSLITKSIIKQ